MDRTWQLRDRSDLALLAQVALVQALRALCPARVRLLIVRRVGRRSLLIERLPLIHLLLVVGGEVEAVRRGAKVVQAGLLFQLQLEDGGHVVLAFPQGAGGVLRQLDGPRQVFGAGQVLLGLAGGSPGVSRL